MILIAVDLIHLITALSRSGYMLAYVFMSDSAILALDLSSITIEVIGVLFAMRATHEYTRLWSIAQVWGLRHDEAADILCIQVPVERLFAVLGTASCTILFRWAWLLVQSVAALVLRQDACREIELQGDLEEFGTTDLDGCERRMTVFALLTFVESTSIQALVFLFYLSVAFHMYTQTHRHLQQHGNQGRLVDMNRAIDFLLDIVRMTDYRTRQVPFYSLTLHPKDRPSPQSPHADGETLAVPLLKLPRVESGPPAVLPSDSAREELRATSVAARTAAFEAQCHPQLQQAPPAAAGRQPLRVEDYSDSDADTLDTGAYTSSPRGGGQPPPPSAVTIDIAGASNEESGCGSRTDESGAAGVFFLDDPSHEGLFFGMTLQEEPASGPSRSTVAIVANPSGADTEPMETVMVAVPERDNAGTRAPDPFDDIADEHQRPHNNGIVNDMLVVDGLDERPPLDAQQQANFPPPVDAARRIELLAAMDSALMILEEYISDVESRRQRGTNGAVPPMEMAALDGSEDGGPDVDRVESD